MKKWLALLISSSILVCFAITGNADTGKTNQKAKPKLENLLTAKLAGVKGTEVIVSRVSIPPNTTLPKHWHPGEEFAYMLEGKLTLWQKGKADITATKGDVVKIPLKQIHTASTKDSSAVVLVFRVHEAGKPERIKVN